jgi:hypothetical protein
MAVWGQARDVAGALEPLENLLVDVAPQGVDKLIVKCYFVNVVIGVGDLLREDMKRTETEMVCTSLNAFC